MADELTESQAMEIINDPANSDRLNPEGPHADRGLMDSLNRAFAKANPQRDREIRMNYATTPVSPEDLNAPQTSAEKYAAWDRAIANQQALDAEQKTGREAVNTPSGDNPGPGFEASKEQFRQDLGMSAGPEFDGHVSNINAWVNETFSSVSEFDKLAEMAEATLGVRGAAELALKLAGEHARRKSRR